MFEGKVFSIGVDFWTLGLALMYHFHGGQSGRPDVYQWRGYVEGLGIGKL